MVKEKADMVKQQTLEQENIILRNKVAEQEQRQAESINALGYSLSNEMIKIRKKGGPPANSITVVEKNDHKNILLWTKYGKPIGPLSPDNAIQTLNRFAFFGIMLTADRPTAEQIEKYKQTPEYKAMIKKEQERRATKDKSKRSGQMEKLTAEIAKMTGTTVEALNYLLKPSEVGKK